MRFRGEALAGGAKIRIEAALSSLKQMANVMSKSNEEEPDDYHWLIIGDLVSVISSLLDHVEGKGHGEG